MNVIKTLSRSLRQYKKTAISTVLLCIAEIAFEILIPMTMAELIDKGIYDGQMSQVWKFGLYILILTILQMITGQLAARFAAKSSVGFSANLREDMYKNVQRFSFSNIDKFSTASIVTRLTTDVTNIQNAFFMILRMAIRGPFMLIFAFIATLRIDSNIAVIYLVVIPILGAGLFAIIHYVSKIFRRVFKTYDKLNSVVEENVSGIRVVKDFNEEDDQIRKFNGVSGRIYRLFVKASQIVALNGPLKEFSMYTCIILISLIGAQAIVASGNAAPGLTTGNLTALITYSMQILISLMILSMVFAMITIASSSAERVAEILKEEPDIINPEHPVEIVQNGAIDFDDVSFVYNKHKRDAKKVLNDIDLHIKSGQTIGILGMTGSAKTSLVQLIPRLYDVTDGSLKVGGVDVRDYDLTSLRDAVAMVLQKNTLFSGTIKENLRWGNDKATDDEIIQACKIAQADDFIQSMSDGYDTYIDQGGVNVSGGQKQRLCIARALLKQPKILILDDSTSAVDTKTDALIREGLSKFMPETTKLIIAQRVSSVQDADQIVLLDDGRITDIGTHEQLMKTNSAYREIERSQRKGVANA